MKDKVGEAWRCETRTVNRNPILIDKFARRLESELTNDISKEKETDKIVKNDRQINRKYSM